MTDELGDHLHTSCFARLIGRGSGSETEKSLAHGILDLIISWEAEHCENYLRQTEEPAFFQHQLGGIFCSDSLSAFFSRLKYITRSDTLCYSPPFCPICLTWCITNTISGSWHATCQTLVEQLPQRPAFFNTTVFFFLCQRIHLGNVITPVGPEGICHLSSVPALHTQRTSQVKDRSVYKGLHKKKPGQSPSSSSSSSSVIPLPEALWHESIIVTRQKNGINLLSLTDHVTTLWN